MNNIKFKNRYEASYTFLRIVNKVTEIDGQTRKYGTNEWLHEAEIYMIKSIKENEGIHVIGISELLGITKGAVSQIIKKLEKKNMIIKAVDPNNLSKLNLRLTAEGEIAYRHHE